MPLDACQTTLSIYYTAYSHTKHTTRGAGVNLVVKGEGTVRWKIEDDNGKVHTILIKHCLYVPDLHICLLSLQHWAQ